MKGSVVVILLLLSMGTQAQTGEEWTQQRKLKLQRLQEQIAANYVYIEYMQKGYAIVSGGLQTIRAIKDGEFTLHLHFIDSLRQVNPRIKIMVKVAEIIAGQLRIVNKNKQAIEAVRASEQFTSKEVNYCSRVFDNLLDECLKTINALVMVITSGQVSMSDGERIQRIDQLYIDMQEQEGFTASFSNELGVLAVHRLTERTEINYSKKIR